MAVNKLFKAACGWDISSLPLGLAEVSSPRTKEAEGIYPTNTAGFSTLHRDVTNAILEYVGLAGEKNGFLYGKFAIVEVTDTLWAAERELSDGTHEVATYSLNGDIKIAKVRSTGRFSAFGSFGAQSDKVDLTTVFMAILPAVLQNGVLCDEKMKELSTNLTDNSNLRYWYLNRYKRKYRKVY